MPVPPDQWGGRGKNGGDAPGRDDRCAVPKQDILGDTMANTVHLHDASNSFVATYATIQDAIDNAGTGYFVYIAAGTYAENVVVDTALNIVGETDGTTGAPLVDVGTAAGTAFTILANAPGADVTISGVNIDGANVGVTVSPAAVLDSVSLDNVSITNSAGTGFNANDADQVGAISIENSSFEKNALGVSTGGDIVIFQYNGDVNLSNVDIVGADAGAASKAATAVQISGFDQTTYDVRAPIGTVVFNDVTVNGDYNKPHLMIQGYEDLNGLSFSNIDLSGTPGWGTHVFVDPIGSSGQDVPGGAGYPGNFPTTHSGMINEVDFSGITVNGTGVTGVYVRGTDALDLIRGTDGNDVLNDFAETGVDFGGGDTILAGGGDDVLIGGSGGNSLNGGSGTDVSVVNGARSEYTITEQSGGHRVTKTATGDFDQMYLVEGVRFSDGITYELDVNSPDFSGALTRFEDSFEAGGEAFVPFGSTVTQEASGSNGVTSSDGAGHLRISDASGGAFTRFDGYRSGESEGLTTKIDIYLDTGMATGEGFDYSVAANSQSGGHLRDFIFHVAKDADTGTLLVGGSNNSSNSTAATGLEAGNHAEITSSGWYTFEHKFYENEDGNLEVAMNVYDAAGTWVFTEVRSDAGDDFDTMFGGNRYGWFTFVDVTGGIAVDNVTLSTLNTDPVQLKDGNTIIATYATVQDAMDALSNGDVTANSAFIETTGSSDGFFYVVEGMSIQAALDASSDGDTILVGDGTYAESVIVQTSVTLQSENGRGATTIDGQDTGPLGAIEIDPNTDNVTIDGFTVLGLNGNGAIEKSAVYIQGNNDALTIINNDIVARGDAGLQSEYAGAVTNTLIDGNIFSGQTFVGANPEGFGFSTQFNVGNNVPRQLVVMGNGGSGGQASNNITFTNNEITGTAGGLNVGGQEQGNTLVTIDAQDSTISDNTFTGETARYATGIRARGENTDIENNSFDNSSGGDTRGVYVDNHGVPGSYAGNTFTGGTDADAFAGTPGADVMTGDAGDDTFYGAEGDDAIDGGADTDTAVFTEVRADVTVGVTTDASGRVTGFTSVTDNDTTDGDEGTDSLTSIEVVQFGDVTLDVSQAVQLFDAADALVGTFDTIQAAVDAAGNDHTIRVAAGTYVEQVVVDGLTGLTIEGTGDDTIIQMAAAPVFTATENGRDRAAVVTVIDSGDITLRDVKVDGAGLAGAMSGGTNPDFEGVLIVDSGAFVYDVTVTGVRDVLQGDGTPQGSQRGNAMVVLNTDGVSRAVNANNNTFEDFQKNGVTVHGTGLVFGFANNTIEGSGFLPSPSAIAQNGLQISGGATGSIVNNSFSEIGYQRGDYVTTNILAFGAGDGLSLINNTFQGATDSGGTAQPTTNVGIYIYGETDNATVDGNTFNELTFGVIFQNNTDTPSVAGNTFTNMFDSVTTNTGHGTFTGDNFEVYGGDNDSALTFTASDGVDYLLGTPFADDFDAGAGNDYLLGGEGDDTLDGGDGTDTAAYAENRAEVTIGVTTDGDGFVTGFTSVTDTDNTDFDEGTDSLTSIEVLELGDVTLDTAQPVQLFDDADNLVGTFDTIQGAIDAASADYTVRVKPGVYDETLSITTDGLTLIGAPGAIVDGLSGLNLAGWDPNTETLKEFFEANNPSYTGNVGLSLNADGVTVSGMTFQAFGVGIQFGDADDALLSGNTFVNNVNGVRKSSTAEVTNSEISGNSFADGIYGMTVYASTAGGSFDGLTIDGNSFTSLSEKGMYFEELSNAMLTGNTFDDVGNFGRISPPFGGTQGEFGQAIDINLKYGTYSDVSFIDTVITNSGHSSGGGSTGLFGGAIGVKTRDDGGTYGANPADFTGQIVFQGGSIDGTSTGFRVGEPGKDNLGPDVLIDGVTIANATVTDVENATDPVNGGTTTVNLSATQGSFDASASQAPVDVTGTAAAETLTTGAGDDTIDGEGGNDTIDGGDGHDVAEIAGNFADATVDIGAGTVTSTDDGTDSFSNIEVLRFADQDVLIVGNGGYATIQEAVDDAAPGATIYVAAGSYAENVVIDKALTIIAADGAELTPASGNGITLSGDLGGGDVTIDNLDILDGGSSTEGVHVAGQANVGTLTLLNLSIEGFDRYGVRSSDGGLASPATLAALVMTDVAMDSNGTGGANGASHVKLFGFDGDAFFNNLSISGEETATAQAARPDNAIEITGIINTNGNANPAPVNPPSAGSIVFTNVDISGSYHKNPVALFHFADILGVDVQSLDLSGAESNWGPLFNIDGVTSSVIDASGFNITFPAPAAGVIHTEIQGEKADQGVVVDSQIDGTAAADSLHGKSGNDTLNGHDGNDKLFGGNKPGGEFEDGSGDDVLDGGAGNDSAYGGEGDDVLTGGSGDDVLDGGKGSDTINGGIGNDTIDGGQQADFIDGGAGDDSIDAGGNGDTIYFSAGTDYVDGGNGFDKLVLYGTPGHYSFALLGVNHYVVTRLSDGAVTEAVNIEKLEFQPLDPLDAIDDLITVDAGAVRTLDVLANDTGSGSVLAAALSGGAEGSVQPTSGGGAIEYDLTTAYKSLDAGQSANVEILYLSSDGSTGSDFATAYVTVNGVADAVGAVTDADGSTNEVDEGLAAGASVGITATAVDPDQGSTVSYSLLDDDDGNFTIDATTGVVTTAAVLDREGPGGASRTIEVQALSSDGTTSTQTFTIDIVDVNDTGVGTPVDDDAAANSVAEGAAADTTVGVTALANDPDVADSVSYSLTDDAGGAFKIDSTTGVVSVANGAAIDRESDATLDITVEALSTDGSTATETFTISVQDVDEFDVTAPADTDGPVGGTVAENAVNGTGVGVIMQATDADATTNGITYSLVDDDGGRFIISATSGEVLVAGPIDREAGATRQITVRATSEDGSFADTNVTIDVTDVDEFDVTVPVDSDGAANTIASSPSTGDYTGVTASASDGDATNSGVTYSLLAGGTDFDIDPVTGAVTVAATYNTGGPVTRSITVQALSQDGSTAQADFDISVGAAYNIIDGTPASDYLVGTADRDVISGYEDDDHLLGMGDDDVLIGGSGDDVLDGGAGDDDMYGGLGDDKYIVDSTGDVVNEAVGEGTFDIVTASISIASLAANVEYLRLSGSADLNGTGNALDNNIYGNSGANILSGLDGRDKLYGREGNDTLMGGADVDILFGDEGNDTLIGGAGKNNLTGGADADAFVFTVMPSSPSFFDRIKDFDAAEGDMLHLDGSVFTAFGGTVTANNFVYGTAAADADDYLIYDQASERLYYDADGSGFGFSRTLIAKMDGVTNADIDFGDFLII